MSYNNPNIQDYKDFFQRDFPFGSTSASVMDIDIAKAYSQVNFNINSALFANQQDYTLGYLYLSAHFLVMNLRASSQGISGQFNFLQSGKGVGGVSESFSIPPMITDNPLLSMYTKTNYGAQFIQLILPQLTGQCFSVMGTTLP